MEKTLLLTKPDAVQRGLVGEIIKRFENKGLKLIAARLLQIDEDLADKLYAVHKGEYFFPRLKSFIASGPVMATVWQGENAIQISRNLMGSTFGHEALPGTIRGDYSVMRRNIVHGSDSPESAEYEIGLFFKEEDILEYDRDIDKWHYDG